MMMNSVNVFRYRKLRSADVSSDRIMRYVDVFIYVTIRYVYICADICIS